MHINKITKDNLIQFKYPIMWTTLEASESSG